MECIIGKEKANKEDNQSGDLFLEWLVFSLEMIESNLAE
jgi:hypothetical protein